MKLYGSNLPTQLIPYASRTGTRRNLAALREVGWRLLVSAKGALRTEGFPYALDNGAWSAYTQGHPFDEPAFAKALSKLGGGADWTVIPDIVAGGAASLEMSLRWMRTVLDGCGRGMLAVQDGISVEDVRGFIGDRVGIFVGGSTEWKLNTMAQWGELAHELGAWCHVGRVNSAKRIALCQSARVTSFDGTSATRFAKTIEPLNNAVRQMAFYLPGVKS